jgi:glycosyltransferase involved in cell wall biosynthesis
MRILLVLEACGGGAGRHVLDLAEGLVSRGQEVHVVWSEERTGTYFSEPLSALNGVVSESLVMRRDVGAHDLTSLFRLAAYARRNGPFDILHGHSSKAGALVRLLPYSIPGYRIYTPHAFRTMDPGLSDVSRVIYSAIERILSQRCRFVLVGSDQESDAAVRIGISRSRIRRIRFGIGAAEDVCRRRIRTELGLEDTDVAVGFVGRFVYQKAAERLVAGFAEVARTQPRYKLVLVGYGEQEADLRYSVDRLNIRDRVLFAGSRDGASSMAAFDVLAVPSRYESLGYVLLEGVSIGLPIISTDVGIARELVVEGKNGTIVPNVDDPKQWREALEYLLTPTHLTEASMWARKMRRRFNVAEMVEDVVATYAEAGTDRAIA